MNPPGTLINPSPATYHATDNSGKTIGLSFTSGNAHGVLWSADGTPTDLNPSSGYTETYLQAIGGSQEVGYGRGTATGSTPQQTIDHALLWTGTSNSPVDLHPSGYSGSAAYGTDGIHQVGYALTFSAGGGLNHATLWSGTAASAVDLHPTQFGSGYIYSWAMGVSGNKQVGWMAGNNVDPVNIKHALLWSGSAASAVDLHPNIGGNTFNGGSAAIGIGGNQQVGYASYNLGNSFTHAMLWTGSAASAIDLNPAGSNFSVAYGTNGSKQVGYLNVTLNGFDYPHAMMWSGSAASVLDLNALLPASYRTSTAYSINSAGDAFGTAVDGNGLLHQVQWIAGPHTATAPVSSGSNQNVTVAGRSPDAGDVKASFSFTGAGTFSNTNSLTTASTLSSQTGPFNFALPTNSGLVQTWDLSFTGSFTGPATLTFHFDPSNLAAGTDLSQLAIAHFTGGNWVALPGTVDPVADTITVSSSTLSPFALVPEPSTMGTLMTVGIGLLIRRPRRILG